MPTNTVEPGQIWETRDKRRPGKRVLVRAVDGDGLHGFADCRTVAFPDRPDLCGRDSRISVGNLRTSYRLTEPTTERTD